MSICTKLIYHKLLRFNSTIISNPFVYNLISTLQLHNPLGQSEVKTDNLNIKYLSRNL